MKFVTPRLAILLLLLFNVFPMSVTAVANDSFGPPQITCGKDGGEPCGQEKKIDAILAGDAEKWGCKGKNLYFTPHKGGQCWSCPDGYKRTAKPIHKPDSCKERGAGFNKERTDATLVRSAYGCPNGTFEKKKQCYRCPEGSKKVSVLGGINPGTKCKTEFYCDSGLELMSAPPKSLTQLGAPYDRVCGTPIEAENVILDLTRQKLDDNRALNRAAAQFVAEAAKDSAIRQAILDKDGAEVFRRIVQLSSYQDLRSKAQTAGYQSFSLGGAPELRFIAGVAQEAGIAMNWNGKSRPYATTTYSKGPSVSAGLGFTLGLWKGNKDSIGGYARGASISIPLGVADVGSGAWFGYYPIDFLGVTYSVSGGIGLDTVNYNEAVTLLY